MKAKVLEVRDRGTFIPVLCVDINPDVVSISGNAVTDEAQRYLMRRVGYPCNGEPVIMLTALNGGERADCDPHSWRGRTYPVAHDYIASHWDELNDGDVIDVECILGETDEPKKSERFTDPGAS